MPSLAPHSGLLDLIRELKKGYLKKPLGIYIGQDTSSGQIKLFLYVKRWGVCSVGSREDVCSGGGGECLFTHFQGEKKWLVLVHQIAVSEHGGKLYVNDHHK